MNKVTKIAHLQVIIRQLEQFPQTLELLVTSIPQSNINRRVHSQWTVYEQLLHLIKAQDIHLLRINQFTDEKFPRIKAYSANLESTEQNSSRSINELLHLFKEKRTALLDLINSNLKVLMDKEGSHEEFSPYNFQLLLIHIVNVDFAHLFQIEQQGLKKL